MSDTIPIMECFGPTIQGEGIMGGTISHFLRVGGCSLRCSWCDSMFAVDPEQVKMRGTRMTMDEVGDMIFKLPYAPYVTFTGGDPCIYEELGELLNPLHASGIKVAVETQGMHFPGWLAKADVVTFSPKGPSSQNIVDITDLCQWLDLYWDRRKTKNTCIKIVIFTEDDFEYALDVYRAIPYYHYNAFYFTAGTPQSMGLMSDPPARLGRVVESFQNLSTLMLEAENARVMFNEKVHVGLQQHVLLWPDKDQGV